jgi:Putative peptidoglycan binding domain
VAAKSAAEKPLFGPDPLAGRTVLPHQSSAARRERRIIEPSNKWERAGEKAGRGRRHGKGALRTRRSWGDREEASAAAESAQGFDPKGIDGDYGGDTRKAVRSFQRANGLQPTGEVDVATWRKLMARPIPTVRDRSLQLTAAFENHDFTLAQGNFDDAGITWGIIGFTLKHGELSKIVLEIQNRKPSLVKQAFGAKADELLKILRGSRAKQLAFADRISLGPSKARVNGSGGSWRSTRSSVS